MHGWMKRMVDLSMDRQRIGEWRDRWVERQMGGWMKNGCMNVCLYICMSVLMKGDINIYVCVLLLR